MKKLSVILGLMVLAACATNPVTGRKQLSTVDKNQVFPESFLAYQTALKESKISTNNTYVSMVQKVGGNIQKAVENYFVSINQPNYLDGYKWEYNVIESKELNAWCMPGGKVAFYTGIFPVCKDDTGVAVVMSHEIAHAIANHGIERQSQGNLVNTLGTIGAIAMGNSNMKSTTSDTILQMYGIGSGVTLLSYSRVQESEADEMGLIFMALAGYDPAQAPEFWKRMSATEASNSQRPPEFLSTHPSSTTRISDLNRLMPIAKQVYEQKSIQPYLTYKGIGVKK